MSTHFLPRKNTLPKVYVIHENEEWVKPLFSALEEQQTPYENWFLNEGAFDLQSTPPEGIFYSRISASSHTRGHANTVALAQPLIQWLELHDRRVINGRQTIQTEISKARQYLLLNRAKLRTPETYVANNLEQLPILAQNFKGLPFIVKPNRGGKGLGVQLFKSIDGLRFQIENNPDFLSPDGIFILQEYIKPPKSEIVRIEFIGGKFYYAVAVDTSKGFELCPADGCEIDDLFCPTTNDGEERPRFKIIEDFNINELDSIEYLLKEQQIDVAGIEYVENEEGQRFFYDINTNTNYNSEAEKASGFKWSGMKKLASYLQRELLAHSALERV